MQKLFAAMLVTLLFIGNITAQRIYSSDVKPPEISTELKKNAVDFLRQTVKEIPDLKAEENRQYFTIETARMLWRYDEKEARAMFERVMEEVKQSVIKTSEKYKKAADELRKTRKNINANYGYSNISNRPANVYSANRAYDSEVYESKVSVYEVGMTNEFRRISSLRRRLVESLIEADSLLAYRFLRETSKVMPEAANNYSYYDYSNLLEQRIIAEMLDKNEVDKAIEVARDVFDNKKPENFREIFREIYRKDPVKGSVFAEEILQKLRGEEKSTSLLSDFFSFAVENVGKTPPVLSDKSLRELAKLLGESVLADLDDESKYFNPYNYAKQIEKYAPREALKIMQKYKQKRRTDPSYNPSNTANYATNRISYPYNAAANAARAAANAANYAVNMPANRVYASNAAVNAARYAANAAAMAANKAANSRKPVKPKVKPKKIPEISEPMPLPKDEPLIETKEDFLQKLRVGKFTPEERKKVIEQAKEYASAGSYRGYIRPDGFVGVVAELARFSLWSADKEVADELMKEAEVYVRPEPKTYADYAAKLMLAGGYSSHHPDKSFAIMESLATINDVIEGAIKLGVFIDTESEFMLNDEVSAEIFLGERGFLRELSGLAEFQLFIRNLAKADFQRTKGLAGKFEKREVKMAAKVLILDSLLAESQVLRSRGDIGY